MPVAQADLALIDIGFLDLTPRVSGESPAVRSLEVAEFDHRHRSVWVAQEMLGIFDQEGH